MSAVEPPGGADYHGRSTRRLANDRLWVDVLVTAGPRIIRLGLAGSDRNLLAETPDLKLGYFNDDGWVAYAHDGALLVRRFDPQPGQPHPDLGCNAETYIGARYVELELLGQLVSIDPGTSAVLVERWQVAEADPGASSADLRAAARELAADA